MKVQPSNIIPSPTDLNTTDKFEKVKRSNDVDSVKERISDIINYRDFSGSRATARNNISDIFSQETSNEIKQQAYTSLENIAIKNSVKTSKF